MNISIDEKKVFGGAAPRLVQLKDYCRLGAMTGGIRARLELVIEADSGLKKLDSW